MCCLYAPLGADPGSIIAMAGELGFEACGSNLWMMDKDAKPVVHVGRGYNCSSNYNPLMTNLTSKSRFHVHEDVVVSSSARATGTAASLLVSAAMS